MRVLNVLMFQVCFEVCGSAGVWDYVIGKVDELEAGAAAKPNKERQAENQLTDAEATKQLETRLSELTYDDAIAMLEFLESEENPNTVDKATKRETFKRIQNLISVSKLISAEERGASKSLFGNLIRVMSESNSDLVKSAIEIISLPEGELDKNEEITSQKEAWKLSEKLMEVVGVLAEICLRDMTEKKGKKKKNNETDYCLKLKIRASKSTATEALTLRRLMTLYPDGVIRVGMIRKAFGFSFEGNDDPKFEEMLKVLGKKSARYIYLVMKEFKGKKGVGGIPWKSLDLMPFLRFAWKRKIGLKLRAFLNRILKFSNGNDDKFAEKLLHELDYMYSPGGDRHSLGKDLFTLGEEGEVFFVLDPEKRAEHVLDLFMKNKLNKMEKSLNLLNNLKNAVGKFTDKEFALLEMRKGLRIVAESNGPSDFSSISQALKFITEGEDPEATSDLSSDSDRVDQISTFLMRDLPKLSKQCHVTKNPSPCDDLIAKVHVNMYTQAVAFVQLRSYPPGLGEAFGLGANQIKPEDIEDMNRLKVREVFLLMQKFKSKEDFEESEITRFRLPDFLLAYSEISAALVLDNLQETENLIAFTDALKTQDTEEYRLALDRDTGWKETRSDFVFHLGALVGKNSPFFLVIDFLKHAKNGRYLLDTVGVRKAFNQAKDEDYGAVFSLLLVHAELKQESAELEKDRVAVEKDMRDAFHERFGSVLELVRKIGPPLPQNVVADMTKMITAMLINCPYPSFKPNNSGCHTLRQTVKTNFIAAVSLLLISSSFSSGGGPPCRFVYNVFTDDNIGALIASTKYKKIVQQNCPALQKKDANDLFSIFADSYTERLSPFNSLLNYDTGKLTNS